MSDTFASCSLDESVGDLISYDFSSVWDDASFGRVYENAREAKVCQDARNLVFSPMEYDLPALLANFLVCI